MGVHLIALSRAADALIARDHGGRVWFVPPEGSGSSKQVDAATAERLMADHGFESVGRDFPSWNAVDEYRQRTAEQTRPRTLVDRDALDAEDVEELLEVANDWLAEDERADAHRLALELLRVPCVRADNSLYDRVLGLLVRLSEPAVPAEPALSPEAKAAMSRRFGLAA